MLHTAADGTIASQPGLMVTTVHADGGLRERSSGGALRLPVLCR